MSTEAEKHLVEVTLEFDAIMRDRVRNEVGETHLSDEELEAGRGASAAVRIACAAVWKERSDGEYGAPVKIGRFQLSEASYWRVPEEAPKIEGARVLAVVDDSGEKSVEIVTWDD